MKKIFTRICLCCLLVNTWSQEKITVTPLWNKTTPINHIWFGLGNVDQMRWILRKDMHDQLQACHDEVGLKHVRAVGIFDDEMAVMGKDPANFFQKEKRGVLRENFRIPFYIYDFLLEMGIYPIVTTNFGPSAMASSKIVTFETKSNITPPADFEAFGKLVRNFLNELVHRYGEETVRHFYFEVWNEPNLTSFWTGTKEQYFELYKIVYREVKNINKQFKVDDPSTASAEWIEDLILYGRANNCEPDYIIGHCYNNDSANAPLSPFDDPQSDKENKYPNFVSGVVKRVHKLLKELDYKGEVQWNEWGIFWHLFAPVRETPNEAAFIIKTMDEVSQLADYFAYWCLSDIYDKETFHSNYGMITLDGLKKPNYFSHQLLCRLGDRKVKIPVKTYGSKTTGVLATKSNNGLQIILYDFNINYSDSDQPEQKNIEISIPAGIDPTKTIVHQSDSRNNNIKQVWTEMDSPACTTKKELTYLKEKNHLTPSPATNVLIRKYGKGFKATLQMEATSVLMIEFAYN